MTEKVTNNARARKVKKRVVRTEAILQKIFTRIADGESLNRICSEPGMPTRKSFYDWVAEDETVLRRYELAMTMRADTYAEETIDIADDTGDDFKLDKDGRFVPDYEVVQRSKLRVDARKWYASKLAPKKYGDKVINEHQGGDPNNPIQQHITVSFVVPNQQK